MEDGLRPRLGDLAHVASLAPSPGLLHELDEETIRTSGPVFLFSQPLQCGVIVAILLISIITNCSVIINIINSDIKKSIVTFVIIKNLCIVDLCGACLILPSPLAATIKGQWDFGVGWCKVNSIINIGIWIEHLIMFALLKVDKIFASVLPIGRYPLSVRTSIPL